MSRSVIRRPCVSDCSSTILSRLSMRLDVISGNLTNYAVILKGALSLIRQIPSEILAEIFLRCRDNDLEDKYYYYTSNPRVAPMLLSQVSHRWRQVSHGTPRLWDHFHLTDPVVNHSIMEHILQRC
ncbi:hypothetical protein B0H15DRAFT_895123 [Mycena belliarum]|uniref:F-box domain-containing protein n=1 Tax=Mycena belliarum TaxID=1033014 RepID=A0AAD6TSG2_9AGAR|nr:hypothetical protein B0H15DRAFT_895123 [Mycena belliae]